MKQKKVISKHDMIRAINSLNISISNALRRVELLEKNVGDYIEMKKDVGSLEKYRSKKKEGKILWTTRLMKWLKGLLSEKEAQS